MNWMQGVAGVMVGCAVMLSGRAQEEEVLPAVPVEIAPVPAEDAAEDASVIDAADVVPDEGEGEEANEKAEMVEPATRPDVTDEGKPTEIEDAVRLQIYLDQKLFGPGFIDGKPGLFTSRAVYAYNRSKGRSPGDWGAVLEEIKTELGDTHATAVVPDVAKEWVNPKLPSSRAAQAKLSKMSYQSYLEFMAERYHTSEDYLIDLNGAEVCNALAPRKSLLVPNIDPFCIELLEHGKQNHESEEFLARSVIIDTKNKQIFIYEPGEAPVAPGGAAVVVEEGEESTPQRLIAAFPITPGKTQFIHRGAWKIANSIELPSWRYDKQLLETGRRGTSALQIPPGPNNPVGILWNGLTKSGIGIHGTSDPRTIGRAQSAGCIRLSNWDVMRFPTLVRPGVKVVVR